MAKTAILSLALAVGTVAMRSLTYGKPRLARQPGQQHTLLLSAKWPFKPRGLQCLARREAEDADPRPAEGAATSGVSSRLYNANNTENGSLFADDLFHQLHEIALFFEKLIT